MTMTSKLSHSVFDQMLYSTSRVVGVVFVGDEDAHLWVALDVPLDPVGAGEKPILHRAGAPGAAQMVGQCLFGSCLHIGLGIGAAGSRTGMDPPVVEHLRR